MAGGRECRGDLCGLGPRQGRAAGGDGEMNRRLRSVAVIGAADGALESEQVAEALDVPHPVGLPDGRPSPHGRFVEQLVHKGPGEDLNAFEVLFGQGREAGRQDSEEDCG